MQITSVVPELINIQWPPIFNQFLEYFDFVNADFISLTGASCVNGLNFNMKFFRNVVVAIDCSCWYLYICLDLKKKSITKRRRVFEQAKMQVNRHGKVLKILKNHKY